ncbi:MAG: hypothetical protein RQ729_11310 [Wenzhouxiangellaceae bacterium]|nr:hypothetical protein [Wenzhouxiangellaceae bacterium]
MLERARAQTVVDQQLEDTSSWLMWTGASAETSRSALAEMHAHPCLWVDGSTAPCVLDLSAHEGLRLLKLAGAACPEQVVLPPHGIRLQLQFEPMRLPDTVFVGRVEGALVELRDGSGERAGHQAFLLDGSDGLVLQSGDDLRAHPLARRHVRLDQSERGLQIKDLRPRVDPQQILWRVLEAARADLCPRTRLLWMARQPGLLDRLLLGSGADGRRMLARWLEALMQPPRANRPFATDRLPMSNLALLALLAGSGHDLRSLWLIRCGLQARAAGRWPCERIEGMFASAEPAWQDRLGCRLEIRRHFPFDLLLFAACCELPETRPYRRALANPRTPLQLAMILDFLAHHQLPPKARALLLRCAVRGFSRLRREASGDRERDPTYHVGAWKLPYRQREALEDLPGLLIEINEPRLVDAFVELAESALPPGPTLDCAMRLHRHGFGQGRHLVLQCLQHGDALSERDRRRAMKCLLSPQGTGPKDPHTTNTVMASA